MSNHIAAVGSSEVHALPLGVAAERVHYFREYLSFFLSGPHIFLSENSAISPVKFQGNPQ
jgi:hypothetical protein